MVCYLTVVVLHFVLYLFTGFLYSNIQLFPASLFELNLGKKPSNLPKEPAVVTQHKMLNSTTFTFCL